jgi:cytidylate kinase
VVITLSRQAEAGGEEIAQLLCERGGLQCADRTLLERIAQREGLPLAQFTIFDEALPGPVEAVITQWRTSVAGGSYLRRLVQSLLLLEREDNVVIIGRGAAFVLTDPGTLHVRIVAPMPCRVARLVQREGIHRAQAQRLLDASDETRSRFIGQSFDADIGNPIHYDVTLSTAELSIEEAADTILLAAQRKSRRRSVAREAAADLLTHIMRFQRRPSLPRVSGATWRDTERRSSG